MTDPKGTWSDGGKVWEGEPQALAASIPSLMKDRLADEALAATPAATRNVLAMTTDENLHATPGGEDGLRDCLQSIADISEEEPREPDDADWRFRCLEAIRAAKTTLAALPASPLRGRELEPVLTEEQTKQLTTGIGSILPATEIYKLGWRSAVKALSASPPEQPAADPVTRRDEVLVPRELTAENGAKYALIGEFFEEFQYVDEDDEEQTTKIPVSWTTIKEIHKKMVAHFSPVAPEPELPAARPMGQS